MKEIKLTRGFVAIVDDEDFEMVSKFKWRAYVKACRPQNVYAITDTRQIKKQKRTFSMHRYILDAKEGEIVDHQNHLTLDNRRSNLRIVSASENSRNSSLRSDNTSGTCGVHFNNYSKRWVARILKSDGTLLFAKHFKNIEDAIAARKKSEKKFNFHENHGKSLNKL